jgi:hypothetical protein
MNWIKRKRNKIQANFWQKQQLVQTVHAIDITAEEREFINSFPHKEQISEESKELSATPVK